MKKIVKILTLSVLAAALFVGCKPTETPTETPTNPDTNNGGSDTPVTTPADDENKDNTGADTDKKDDDKGSATPAPTLEVYYELDFSKTLPENWYVSTADFGSIENGALKLPLTEAKWDGAFTFVPQTVPDFKLLKKIEVVIKGDNIAAGDNDNDKISFMIADKNSNNDNISWQQIYFYDHSSETKLGSEYITLSSDANWELKYDKNGACAKCEFEDAKDIKLNTQNLSGTIYIKSIKLYK